MAVRITTDPTTGEQVASSPLYEPLTIAGAQPRPSNAVAPEAPVNYREGGRVTRVTVGHDGEVKEVTETRRSDTIKPNFGPVYATNAGGMKMDLASATIDSTVTLPSLGGETSVKAALALGAIRSRAGGGYEVTNPQDEQAAVQAEAVKQQAAQAPEVQVTAADVRGVTPTTATTDQVMNTLRAQAPAQLDHFANALATGKPVNFDEAARVIGSENARGALTAAMGEYQRVGAQILTNCGVQDLQGFEEHVRSTDPEGATDAIRALVVQHDVAPLARLAKRYVAGSSARLVTLLNAKGAETRVEQGVIYVKRSSLGLPPTPRRGDFGGSDWSTVADLMRDGIITR